MRILLRRPLLTILFFAAVAGCDRSRGGTVSGGLWDESDRWVFEEEWRIGGAGAEGAQRFGGPVSLSLGPDGLVYVADPQSNEVNVFTSGGEHLRRLAGPGSGPGEMRRPTVLTWDDDDRLWIVNRLNGRFSVFDTLGNLVAEIPRPPSATPRYNDHGVFSRDGRFGEVISAMFSDGSEGIQLVLVDSSGARSTSSPPIRQPGDIIEPGPPGLSREPSPALQGLFGYVNRLIYSFSNDDHIWFAESDNLRLIKRSFAGDTSMVVEADHRRYELSPEEERMLTQTLRNEGMSRSRSAYGRQIIQSIYVRNDDHVLVQIETEAGQDGREFDVFNPVGEFLGTLDFSFGLDPMSASDLRGDTIVAATRDEFDAIVVVRGRIRRSAN